MPHVTRTTSPTTRASFERPNRRKRTAAPPSRPPSPSLRSSTTCGCSAGGVATPVVARSLSRVFPRCQDVQLHDQAVLGMRCHAYSSLHSVAAPLASWFRTICWNESHRCNTPTSDCHSAILTAIEGRGPRCTDPAGTVGPSFSPHAIALAWLSSL